MHDKGVDLRVSMVCIEDGIEASTDRSKAETLNNWLCLIYRYRYILFPAYSTSYPVFDRFSIAL